MNARELDAQKLHAESLQLRNQQFTLGTIALAGSGLAALLPTALAALGTGRLWAAMATLGGIIWLVALQVLFQWSLSLRSLIAVISHYLDVRGDSEWEPAFRRFHGSGAPTEPGEGRAWYRSQSVWVAVAFVLYGTIAVATVLVPSASSDGALPLSVQQHGFLVFGWMVHTLLVSVSTFARSSKEGQIRERWEQLLQDAGETEAPDADTAS